MSKKIQDSNELFKKVIEFSCFLLIITSVISSRFFYIDNQFDYKGWITLVASFAGALIGGIFTMFGVIKTIENDKKNKFLEEQERLNNIKVRIKIEIEASLNSIREYYLNMLLVKKDWLKTVSHNMDKYYIEINDDKILDWHQYTMYDVVTKVNPKIPEIYFLDLNIKNDFFELTNKVKFKDSKDRESILNEFIELYKFEKKLLDLSKRYSIKEHKFMFNITRMDIDSKFITENLFLIERYINLKKGDKEKPDVKLIEYTMDQLRNVDMFGDKYSNLLKFLNEEY
ncbi:hypothetical protein QTI80_13515 [Clostridium perfringens]|uniref:hypothetical protein n=1 Tax=Clostridium perfringens TaxID=1502 RepID=UPI001CC90D4A|nr:hypothetical protein [Clostridium perfringens]MDM0932752.1 hypothetical protein [Clostridium perfringens]UBK54505.1 hypothetical protein KLF47_07105 [Clostridium perfringens]